MTALLPAGMIRFRAALARVAEVRFHEPWSETKQNEREWLFEEGVEVEGFQRRLFTRPDAVAGRAYGSIRPSLAEGVLPALRRGQSGPPEAIDASFWTSRGADRLEALTAGDILIREADLVAVLKGQPAPSLAAEYVAPPLRGAMESKAKGGRPHNADLELFWIEMCRLVASGSLPREQAAYVRVMAQWAVDRMAKGYEDSTVRLKVSKFFDAAGWR